MRAHTLSMSKVHLAVICSHGFRGDVTATPRASGKEAKRGTAVHAIIEAWYHLTAGPDLSGFDEKDRDIVKRTADQAIRWLTPQRERILLCEVGLRYDADADRAVVGPRRGEAGYDDVGPMVLPGTLDLVLRGVDGVLEVLDVKTGKPENAHVEQLRSQTVAVARLYAEKQARHGFLFPKLTKCDEPDWASLDEDALDLHAGEMHALLSGIPTAEPKHGEHCFRCDYRPDCPAYKAERDEHEMEQRIAAGVL